jgi:cytoskeletal protein CcmA (bactofilin family)
VVGNIAAQEHLFLESTGSIDGDVSTNALVVENGGSLNGRTTMLHSAEESVIQPNDMTSSNLDELQFGPDFKIVKEDMVTSKT